jgi:hypothetical protein
MHPAVNFLAFQAGWFACVLSAARGHPWLGVAVASVIVGLHLSWVDAPGREARLVGLAVLMGLVLDSMLVATGWLAYANGQMAAGLAPYWILAMWALFATTMNVTMRWMRNRHVLAALLGLVGGPLSYLAGQRLGAVQFTDTLGAAAALAVVWAVAMPVLVKLSERFDGVAAATAGVPARVRGAR